MAGAGLAARLAAPLAVAAGVLVELAVLKNGSGGLDWLPPVLVVAGVLAVGGLTIAASGRLRAVALGAALATLMIAPAAWSVQTLGHPTSGTFPAGGSATASFGGGRGGPGGGGMRLGPPPGALTMRPPGGPGGGGFGGPAGGGFGGNSQYLTQALAYVQQHGGGTIGVSSQTGASATIISSGAKVAGLGGFSGRESEVSVSWLAGAVRSGQIRWVLADSGGMGGPGRDGRVGSSKVMTAVAATCKKTSVPSLYDCQGSAAGLAAYNGGAS
jgi:hypothetical protein